MHDARAASVLFQRLVPIVLKHDRQKRMTREDMSVEEVRRSTDMDLATRLRMKKPKAP